MIGLVRGILVEKGHDSIVVECNGIGYELYVPESHMAQLPPVDQEVMLYTHLAWKEDSISLYGFLKKAERDMFRMLIQVSGVGPKMAMNCLSVLGQRELLRALSAGDVKRLQAISGIGKKTAARLCVDLKEKAKRLLALAGEAIGSDETVGPGPSKTVKTRTTTWHEAYSALLNLGYRPNEIKRVLEEVFEELGESQVQELSKVITLSLRHLSH